MFYIHNIYENMNAGDITSQFGMAKLQQQMDVALGQIGKLNEKFKADIEEKTEGLVNFQEVMEFLEQATQLAATASMKELQAISGTAVREAIDGAMSSGSSEAIAEMGQQFANLRNAFESFSAAYEQASQAAPDTPMGQAYIANKVTLDRAAEIVRQSLANSSFKRLAGGGYGSSTKDNLSSLRGFASQLATGKLFTDASGKGISPAAAIGFLAEGVYGNALKQIASTMTFGGKFKLQVKATGAESEVVKQLLLMEGKLVSQQKLQILVFSQ